MSPNLCSIQIFSPLAIETDLSKARVYSSRAAAPSGASKISRARLIFRVIAQQLVKSLLFLSIQIREGGLQTDIEAIGRDVSPRFGNRAIEQGQTLLFADDGGRRGARKFRRREAR